MLDIHIDRGAGFMVMVAVILVGFFRFAAVVCP